MTGKWIWSHAPAGVDEYAEFHAAFSAKAGKTLTLRVACDGVFCAYLNDKLVLFSGCSDFPHYKFFDETEIGDAREGENLLRVLVWHPGEDSQTYIKDTAGVCFEAEQQGEIVAKSDAHTPSRVMNEYKNGYRKRITYQLGYSFLYDATAQKTPFSDSVAVDKPHDLHKRPIRNLVLEERQPIRVIPREGSVLIDMGRETAGFADLEFESPADQHILFTYGEHIADGGVRRVIGNRDFSFEVIAKKGENRYINSFRRIAGRYIEIFCRQPVKIGYIGIRPVSYPAQVLPVSFADPDVQKIYDVCVRTLRLCMHEHYEDCPWREQALYTMDSRNQMLCGYSAFAGGNAEYAAYNLLLISKGLRPDGLLSLCYPSGDNTPIPFFSLCYIVQVYEYVRYTGDRAILAEVGDVLRRIIRTFTERIDERGLVPAFPAPYWNFYEWAEESHRSEQLDKKTDGGEPVGYDLILNCMLIYALERYDALFGEKHALDAIRKAVRETFYQNGVFKLSTATAAYSQLGNAMAILAGLGDAAIAERIVHDPDMISATLSMRAFVYDALLAVSPSYGEMIIKDIKKRYLAMLAAGATSFWETEKGCEDFGGAASLCHGWSAIPIYYFHRLLG